MKNKTFKTIAILTAAVTSTIHVINRIQYSLYTNKNILPLEDNKTYEWRFGKICYHKKGSGSPILMIHDLTTGSSKYEFHRLVDELSITNEIYCIDLLGYGLSDKPNMTYTNYLYVQLVIDFIKNIIGRKTDIIATGDSAPVAVMACHNDPEVFNRLLFINPQSLYKLNQIPSRQTRILKLLIDIPVIGTFIYNILTCRCLIEKDFKEKYFKDAMNIKEDYIYSYMEASHRPDYNSKYSFASYTGRYMNANILHALKEINHSIYIIAGEEKEDSHTTIENYEYYNQSIETAFIPMTRQLPHLENPVDVLKQLLIFLS